ncbi:hypothetical protein BD413DRAFT_501213 [Trametes elegans]|nr:hypothetical protein BD413DRAFT_501213 [Trametes elegans]
MAVSAFTCSSAIFSSLDSVFSKRFGTMASSSAAVVQLYQDVFADNCCGLAAASMFLYDTLVNLDREIQLVWRSQRNAASLLYLFNRYLTVVQLCLGLPEIAPMSDNVSDIHWCSPIPAAC